MVEQGQDEAEMKFFKKGAQSERTVWGRLFHSLFDATPFFIYCACLHSVHLNWPNDVFCNRAHEQRFNYFHRYRCRCVSTCPNTTSPFDQKPGSAFLLFSFFSNCLTHLLLLPFPRDVVDLQNRSLSLRYSITYITFLFSFFSLYPFHVCRQNDEFVLLCSLSLSLSKKLFFVTPSWARNTSCTFDAFNWGGGFIQFFIYIYIYIIYGSVLRLLSSNKNGGDMFVSTAIYKQRKYCCYCSGEEER